MDLQLLVTTFLAIGVGAFIKGVSGLGLPVIAIPVLATFVGVPHAVAVMLVPIIVTNAWQVWQYRGQRRDALFLRPLLPVGIAGIAIGTVALKSLPSDALRLLLAALVVVYVTIAIGRPDWQLARRHGDRIAAPVGLLAGCLQGATGISSPVLVTYLHAMRLERQTFVFAVSTAFVTFASAQLLALIVAGIMTGHRFLEGLLALVPVFLLMPLGGMLSARISRTVFDRIVLGSLVVVAAKLVYDALVG